MPSFNQSLQEWWKNIKPEHHHKITEGVAEYEDKELKIVNSALDAEAARPDIDFEIVAEARWYEGQGHPCWIVTDKEADSVEVASADHDGNVVDQVVTRAGMERLYGPQPERT